MNKRQYKKREKKCLPVVADEVNFCTMTEKELDQAIEEKEKYRKKYGYRKRYKDLKGKYLVYHYPIGTRKEVQAWMLKIGSRCRKKPSHWITQNTNNFLSPCTDEKTLKDVCAGFYGEDIKNAVTTTITRPRKYNTSIPIERA